MPPIVYLLLVCNSAELRLVLGIEDAPIAGATIVCRQVSTNDPQDVARPFSAKDRTVAVLAPSLHFDSDGHYVSELRVSEYQDELRKADIPSEHIVLLEAVVSVDSLRKAIRPVIAQMLADMEFCL